MKTRLVLALAFLCSGSALFSQTHTTDTLEDAQTVTGAKTFTAPITATGNVSVGGTLVAGSVNNVKFADQQSGSDAFAKIATAISACSATPCVIDARGFVGVQAVSTQLIIPSNTAIYFGEATFSYSGSTPAIIIGGAVKARAVVFQGAGKSLSAASFGGIGTLFKCVGCTGTNPLIQFKSISNVYAADFTVDCNATASIGWDYTALNSVGAAVGNTFARISAQNCTAGVGQGLHVGSATNDQVGNATFSNLWFDNNNDSLYLEGSQTVDHYFTDVEINTCVNNGVNYRGGATNHFTFLIAAGTGCGVPIRISNQANTGVFDHFEFEQYSTTPIIIEADTAAAVRQFVFTNGFIQWSGAAAGKLIDVEESCNLTLGNLQFVTAANTGQLFISPAHGRVFLTEYSLNLAVSPAIISRSYTNVQGHSSGDAALPAGQAWTEGSTIPFMFNLGAGASNAIIQTKDSGGNGWRIDAGTSTSSQFQFWRTTAGTSEVQWDMTKGAGYFTENAALGGSAGTDLFWADSAAHRFKVNNNNGGATTLAVFADNLGVFASGGTITPATIVSGGTAAALTGTGACATITTQTGGAWAGRATCTGTTGASTLTITPGTTAPNGWVCYVQDQTTRANLFQQTATVAGSCTLTVTSVTQNDVFVFTAIAF